MNDRLLLSDLRAAGVNLTPQGDGLHVDAPAGTLTEALKGSLAENKEALIELLDRKRVGPEASDRRGLLIRWSEHPVWIELRDPLTGEWHEVRATECLPGVVESANREAELERGSEERRWRVKPAAIVDSCPKYNPHAREPG